MPQAILKSGRRPAGPPAPPPRSAGALRRRRVPVPWTGREPFRILSLDGGGIRGIFQAAFLAGLEQRYLGRSSVADYFDLITGTSTGGVIALGLGKGLCASTLRDLYLERGGQIFPPGRLDRSVRVLTKLFHRRYDRNPLMAALSDHFGDATLAQSRVRLCVPSVDARYRDLYVFKTPHHPDFKLDRHERMTKVGAATSAAPTYFHPFKDRGYTFLDGGVWANNPIMVGLVDALSCFDLRRSNIRILSIGCTTSAYRITKWQTHLGGLWHWRRIIDTAMHFQSCSAVAQAGLLLGADRITRIEIPDDIVPILTDDYRGAVEHLPGAAKTALDSFGSMVASTLLSHRADPFRPVDEIDPNSSDHKGG